MAMKKLKIMVAIAASQGRWQNMVYLKLVAFSKEEATKGAMSPLPFKEGGDFGWSVRVRALSPGPVHPISVERTFRSLHFHMPLDRDAPVMEQAMVLRCKLPASLLGVPISVGSPFARFVGMASFRPAPEPPKRVRIHLAEAAFGTHMCIVARPSANEWVEMPKQRLLRCCQVSVDNFFDGLLMALEGHVAGSDERFEPKSGSIAPFS